MQYRNFRATTNTQKMPLSLTEAPARRAGWRGWIKKNWFLNRTELLLSLNFSDTTDAVAKVLSLGRCARAAAILLLLLLPLRGEAITGTLTHVDLPAATDAELAETVGPRGRIVMRSADPKDLRIFDGYTPGGISLWNFNALTSPPSYFPHDVSFGHHHVRLDGSYSLNAEAGRLTAWYGTNAIWQIIAAASAADDVLLSVEPEGTNMAFTVAIESDDVGVEACSSLANPVWTAIAFGLERLSPLTVKITVPNPPVGEMQYVRVLTGGGDVGMVVSIPLSVPSLNVGGAAVTAGTVSNWNAAHAWGNHAQAGYLMVERTSGWSRIRLGSERPDDDYSNGSIVFGDRADEIPNELSGFERTMQYGPLGQSVDAWEYLEGTNVWKGRVGDTEAGRIASLPSTYASGATNYFLRPDGGTNTVFFDVDGNMLIAVDGTTAMTIRTNGNIGVKHSGSGTYQMYVAGDIYATARMRALEFRASDAGGYYVDPNGVSMLASASFDGTLTVTQGVTKIILPDSTNNLVPGTLWWNVDHVDRMP